VRWLLALPLAAVGGLAIGLAGAPREWAALGFAGPAFVLVALERIGDAPPTARRGLAVGLVAATTTNVVALYWVVGLLRTFAGFPLVAAVPTGLLLWVAQALSFGFACAGASALASRGFPGWLALPACLVVASTLTPSLFPWRLAGTQVPWTTWIQMAEIGGEPLVDLCVALVGCGVAEALRTGKRSPLVVAAVVLLAPALYGAVRIPEVRARREAAPVLRVGVVQPNVGISEKRDPALRYDHLHALQDASHGLEEEGADLVIWPETAYPFRIQRNRTRDVRGPPRVLQRGVEGPLLFGAITTDRRGGRYNSAVAMGSDGRILGISDKVRLLAFGEYVPLWDWLPPLQERFPRGLSAGEEPRVLEVAGARVGVLNCYEDVLPHFARWVTARDPDFLVNVTNDAWFGDTAEPHLHQMVARMRTVETRRELVRAVNTGVSSHTNALGEDVVRTGTWVRRAFVTDVALLEGRTVWVRFGDLVTPTLAGALLGVVLALGARRRLDGSRRARHHGGRR